MLLANSENLTPQPRNPRKGRGSRKAPPLGGYPLYASFLTIHNLDGEVVSVDNLTFFYQILMKLPPRY